MQFSLLYASLFETLCVCGEYLAKHKEMYFVTLQCAICSKISFAMTTLVCAINEQ